MARYQDIPQPYLDLVRRMWADIPGESHSSGYRIGCQLLEDEDSRYAVNVTEWGTPEGYTDQHLRLSRATWGDRDHPTGWIYGYGEEDWYTSVQAIEQTKAHLTYCHSQGLAIAAMGFGWCWDTTWHNSPGGGIDPVYQVRWAGSSVGGPEGDLRWGLDGADYALTGNSVCMDTPFIHADNMLDLDGSYQEDGDHIGERGALRLAKALWWMLARIAGWQPEAPHRVTLPFVQKDG